MGLRPSALPRGTGYPCRCGARGGLPFWSPAAPAFSLFVCPHPPNPLPGGKGGIKGYFMQGASPLASPGLNPGGTGAGGANHAPGGGLVPGGTGYPCRYSARGGACLLCRLPALPLACFSAPIPPTPFPAGWGGLKVILCKGLRPLHPRALNRLRHLQSLPNRYQAQRKACGSTQNRQKGFPISSAGSQGEGGPGEMELSVASDGGV